MGFNQQRSEQRDLEARLEREREKARRRRAVQEQAQGRRQEEPAVPDPEEASR
jgi:hypothetical protein